MTAFGNVDSALNILRESHFFYSEEKSDIFNLSIFLESEDLREMFLEIPNSFWQKVFSRRHAQPQVLSHNPQSV